MLIVLYNYGIKFSTVMDNTTNDLDLKFYVHAYGSQIGDLYVYIDDSKHLIIDQNKIDIYYILLFTSNSSYNKKLLV